MSVQCTKCMQCTRTVHMHRDEQSLLVGAPTLVLWPCTTPYRPCLGTHCSTATASRQCTLSAKTAPTLPSRDCSASGCGSTPSRRPHTHAYCICVCENVSRDCSLRLRNQPPARLLHTAIRNPPTPPSPSHKPPSLPWHLAVITRRPQPQPSSPTCFTQSPPLTPTPTLPHHPRVRTGAGRRLLR